MPTWTWTAGNSVLSLDRKEFSLVYRRFFPQISRKKEQIEFVGPVYDKKLLWEYYNRAKVFVCTSRWESSGIVLNEAKRFRNYIVTTRVGEAEDLVEQEKYGAFVPQEDAAQLVKILSQIVSGVRETDVYQGYDVRQLSYQSRVKVLSDFLSH